MDGFDGDHVLSRIAAIAAEAPGSDRLYSRLSARLGGLYPIVSSLGEDAQWRQVRNDYCNTASGFLRMLREQKHNSKLLFRLATCPEVVSQVRGAHARLDNIYQALGVREDEALTRGWIESWEADLEHQKAYFVGAIAATTPFAVTAEFTSPMKLEVAIVVLDKQIRTHEGTEHGNVSDELLLLMRATRDAVVNVTSTTLPEDLYKWFIFPSAVEKREKVGEGMISTIYRAEWASPDRDEVIALKKLSKADDSDTFSSEIEVWWGLEHRHILKMLAANHRVTPKFFVCEFANAGNFTHFFADGENSEMLWSLFAQAADGLAYLHSRNVEYGGLKCNNLLLHREKNGELVVKLSDFGLSRVRTQSVPVSIEERQDNVRWQAPERLVQGDRPIDFSKADIHSLGLCVIEAVTGETPFDMWDVDDIIHAKLHGQPIDRPAEGFIDDREWELVARMVEANPENRPGIDEVIAIMGELDAIRAGLSIEHL